MPRVATTANVRGPYAKSARVQAAILDQAMQAFAERGFSGTSMREIAIAVGMTQQGLRHHFPTKEALLEAVLQRRDQAALEHYNAAGLSVMDTLRAVAQDVADTRGMIRLWTMLAAEATSPDYPAHRFFRGHFDSAREVFTLLMRRGQKHGEIRDDVPAAELATIVVSIFEGLQLQWLIDPGLDLPRSFQAAVRVLEPVSADKSPRKRSGR